jgi:putative ABC transport system permease protein
VRLFNWFIVRRILHEPLRSALTTVGIALGVAVVVAIQLTNASSLAGFETALNTVSGRTSLEIIGTGAGIDETLLPALGWLRQYGEVAPVIEGDLVYREPGHPAEILRMLGVDILRDQPFREYNLLEWTDPAAGRVTSDARSPQGLAAQEFLGLLLDPASAVVAARFAQPRGLTVGSTFDVNVGDRIVRLTIRGLLKDEGPARVLDGRFVMMDIAAAQQALERYGWIDRVEVRLPPGTNIDAAEAAVARALPGGLSVQRPAQRGKQVEHMLAAFHLNLTALSYIALLVGLFLVYNTVSVAVLARRAEIGTLRSLGVSSRGVRTLFLAEAAALAAVGSAAGVLLGRVLANATVALTSTTVSTLYIATAAAPPALGWRHVVLAFATGIPLSLLAALVPAVEASRVPPMAAIRGADQAAVRGRFPVRSLGSGIVLLITGAWLATFDPVRGLPLFGYAAAVVLVFGASFLVPATLFAVAHGAEPLVRRLLKVEDWLAVTNLGAAIPRLSISVAALAVSLSMMVAVSIMIGSFRETVNYWVRQTLQADLFVSPGARHQGGAEQALSPDVMRTVASSPDAAAVDAFRSLEVPYGDTRVRVGARDFNVVLEHGTLLFKAPADAREAMRRAIGQDAVVVSESFVIKQHLGIGQDVQLPTTTGPARFRIAAVFFDYSNDRGVLLMDRTTFERHYGDVGVGALSVYLRAGSDPDAARQRLLSAIGDTHRVIVNTNASLRTEVLRIFDSTFAITYALELIAIIVAILGVSGTLLTLILERERDVTILRLIGTGRGQVRRMVVGEAVLIGAISQAVGLIVGLLLSLVLIYVINVQSFGWTIQFHLPTGFLIQSSVLMVLATALAGLYPARRAQNLGMSDRPVPS